MSADDEPPSGEDDFNIPEDHPLHGKEHLLDTHAGHLEAFAEVLEDADPDTVNAAMVVLSTDDGTDTLPTVAPYVDAETYSWLMLAGHISHLANTYEAHPSDIAKHAVHVLLGQGPGGAVDGF